MELELLAAYLKKNGEPAFRLRQIKRAYYFDLLPDWEAVTTLSKQSRDRLRQEIPWDVLIEKKSVDSEKGDTVKKLFACNDGGLIETVLMSHEDGRNTVCVSSQVGCPMKCSFCATGKMGFKRNLSAAEISEQVIRSARLLKEYQAKVTNVVFMGMGEPLHNYEAVMAAVRILNDHEGFNLGARHMTLSTCGIVPGIEKLANEKLQVNLAVSLHSAIDETRSKIMPVNRAYPLAALMEAIRGYAEKTNRKIFFEYTLMSGVNDDEEHARALVELLGENRRLYHVNLIKYHETGAFEKALEDTAQKFFDYLKQNGILATRRVSFGEDIEAACGQLAATE